MENQVIKDPASPKASVQNTPGRLERFARIAYLIVALFVYSLMFSPKVGASETATLTGNHPSDVSGLIVGAPGNATLSIDLSFALRNRARLNYLLGAQQDPTSPLYQHWLTPVQFDARFGRSAVGGDCLAVAEDSDYLDAAVSLFDSKFALPAAAITRVLPDITSPGANGDEIETLLDLEWAHAVAPGAPIRDYIGNGAVSGSPLLDAIKKAVTDNTCGAISISYCGASSSFYTSTLDSIFAQAAAQGRSVFISSGDQGAAGRYTQFIGNRLHCRVDQERQRDGSRPKRRRRRRDAVLAGFRSLQQ
jgi:subtilase family serine protease